jgi:uncharacterized protein YjbI with pentapeptide repeats|tara:strand:- start:438 stop:1052 length:615 start_codon:yes stop_codon:yes gene_type:complete
MNYKEFSDLEYELLELDTDICYKKSTFSKINESWINRDNTDNLIKAIKSNFDGKIITSVIEPGIYTASKFNDLIYDSELSNSKLPGSKFSSNIIKSTLNMNNMRGIVANNISLKDSSLFGSDLFKAKLNGTDLSNCDLASTNLEMAELRYANLTNTNIENVENITNAIFYETIVDENTYKKIWEEFSNRGIYLHTNSQDYFNIL